MALRASSKSSSDPPKNWVSVKTDMPAIPAASYPFATASTDISLLIMGLLGERRLNSAMIPVGAFNSASASDFVGFVNALERSSIEVGIRSFFAETSFRLCAVIFSKIVMLAVVIYSVFVMYARP